MSFCRSLKLNLSKWKRFIDELLTRGMLSLIESKKSYYYKLNLKTEKGDGFITHEYVIKKILKNLLKNENSKLTARELRIYITYSSRPKTSDWESFLEDLVRDGFLKSEKVNNILKFFI